MTECVIFFFLVTWLSTALEYYLAMFNLYEWTSGSFTCHPDCTILQNVSIRCRAFQYSPGGTRVAEWLWSLIILAIVGILNPRLNDRLTRSWRAQSQNQMNLPSGIDFPVRFLISINIIKIFRIIGCVSLRVYDLSNASQAKIYGRLPHGESWIHNNNIKEMHYDC